MIRALSATILLASGWSFTDLSLERLQWNPRERTAEGIEKIETEARDHALEAFETGARLDPADPLLRFNAGSAHLVAAGPAGSLDSADNSGPNTPGGPAGFATAAAIEHLQAAADTASGELAAQSNYNLGNAKFAAGDMAGAIEAFENSLRLMPANEDAKFNLEVALQQQEQQQQQEQGGEKNDEENQKQENQQSPDADQEQDQGQDEQQQQQQDSSDAEKDQQLPQFEDQPDMTAEQAAAILEAVENLEREQRRKQAQEQAKKRPRKGKDW